eukprot:s6177_g4.t1
MAIHVMVVIMLVMMLTVMTSIIMIQPSARETAVWFCLFANYQVGDESGPSIEAQLSLKPFASVISAASLRRGTGYGLHAIHTSTADLYQRLWCVHEVERALKGDIDVSTSMSDKYKDLQFSTSSFFALCFRFFFFLHVHACCSTVKLLPHASQKEQTLQRLQFFLSESCSTSTWEDCMWAANVKVKTIQARCDRMEDEQMLIAEIMATGGFERIDATIERLKFASFERLERKLIHNLVLTAVRSSGASLAHAPVELKADKDLVIEDPLARNRIPRRCIRHYDVAQPLSVLGVREAVRQNGMALQYAAEEMRLDRDVVLNAVQSDGLALQFASGPALMDHAVVLAADSMKKNREIMEKAVTTSPKALAYVPSELQKDALEVVKSSPEAVLQLERSMTEQQVERMEEMAVTRRHAKESEKEQERLQKWLDLMKSVRPQDPSVISRARQAIEKQFDTTTDEDKMDYVDVLLDNSIAMHATLKNSLFKCLVEYKLKLADKAGATVDPKTSSSPVRRYSMHVPKLEPTPSMESERSERHSGRAFTAATKIQESAANGRPPEVQANMSSSVQVSTVAFTMSGTADGRQERFEKPWLMTFIMFVSMTLALPFDAGMWRKSSPEPLLGGQVADRWREKVRLRSMGFLYIPASVWQLLRGAEIVFAAIFAVTCLHRRLYCFQYIGLAFCVAGIFLVGLASVWGDDMEAEAKGKDSGNVQLLLIGICLALAGQVVQAAQAVAEDAGIGEDVDLPGLQVVGFEGVWGALAMLVFVFPTLYMLPGQDHGHAEDEVNAYELLRINSMLTALMGLYIFSCATYNISGIAVTGALSAVHRVMIEALRTLIVWAFGLSIHYLVDPKSALGEVAGFLLLVIGQVIYGAMVKIPRLYYPPSEEMSHDVVASPGSLRNLTALPDARFVSPGSHDGRVAGTILKNAARIGQLVGSPSEGIGPKWCHPTCFLDFIKSRYASSGGWFKKHVPEPEQIPGFGSLTADDRAIISELVLEGKNPRVFVVTIAVEGNKLVCTNMAGNRVCPDLHVEEASNARRRIAEHMVRRQQDLQLVNADGSLFEGISRTSAKKRKAQDMCAATALAGA